MTIQEELLDALELIQGFNWQLDDSAHGKEIKRRAEAAIKRAKSQHQTVVIGVLAIGR